MIVKAYIGRRADIENRDELRLKAENTSEQNEKASAYGGGIIAVGITDSHTKADVEGKVVLDEAAKINVDKLDVEIENKNTLFSESVAGKGGVVSGSVSFADTNDNSSSRADIVDLVSVNANTIDFDINNISNINSKINTINAAVVGASGGRANNRSDVGSYIYVDAANLQTSNMFFSTYSKVSKPWLDDDNIYSGSGGVVDAAAIKSETLSQNNSKINLDKASIISYNRDKDNTGTIDILAQTESVLHDKVKLISGGAISIAKAESFIEDNSDTDINIKDSMILTTGNLYLSSLSDSDSQTKVRANTYGVSSVAEGNTKTEVDVDDTINITGPSQIKARNVYLSTGIDRNNNVGEYTSKARADLFNNSALPFETDPYAKGSIKQNHEINIEKDARIESVEDIKLVNNEGYTFTSGLAKAQNTYDEDLSRENIEGRTEHDYSAGIKVDGSLAAGVDNIQRLHIDKDGKPVEITDGIKFDLKTDVVTEEIEDEIERLKELQNDYTDLDSAYDSFQDRIDELELQLEALSENRNTSNTIGYSIYGDPGMIAGKGTILFELHDVIASMGNIKIESDNLYGSGKLSANPYAEIKNNK